MTPVARIDHVLYGVQDLDLAAGRLEADHGLVARLPDDRHRFRCTSQPHREPAGYPLIPNGPLG